ncbi:MAG: ATP-binding protein [Actinomycetota bacterium]
MIVTAIALAIAAIVLLSGLRGSLLDEIDDSVSDQAWDYSINVFEIGSLETVPILNDEETLLVIFDETGELFLANDTGVEVSEILLELPVRDSLEIDEPLLVDASIETSTETTGKTSLRAAITPAFFEEQDIDDPYLFVLVARSTEGVDETVASTRNRLLVLFPLLTALVGLLAWWITGRSLRPVDVMRREVDEISAGDLSRRVSELGSQDEVGRLATTMNSMLGRLESSTAQQRQFVSDAAHELRTPLASIAAQLDVDAAHPDSADRAATAVSVRSEVDRMQHMIESMLALARSDQGRSPEVSTLLDLDEIARTAASRVPKPETVALDLSGIEPVEVRGDQGSLLRVVDNLLANAYRHAGSLVALSVGSDQGGTWLTVDDDGSGVPADKREAVFERFVRLDEARTRDAGGSGLGLALSREIAKAHGGTLFVIDSTQGGAQFVLRLPSLAPAGSPQPECQQ